MLFIGSGRRLVEVRVNDTIDNRTKYIYIASMRSIAAYIGFELEGDQKLNT